MPSRRAATLPLLCALLLGGCGSAQLERACVPPPAADCSTYRPPADQLPESMSGDELARVAIGARRCGGVVGQPIRTLRRSWGRPAVDPTIGTGNGTKMVWTRGQGDAVVRVVAAYDARRIVTGIFLHREGAGGVKASQPFCGEVDFG